MTRVRVDFNSRGPGGTVRGSRRRADGDLEVGQMVEIFDDAEGMSYRAHVADLDANTGRALFEVDWEPAPQPRRDMGARFAKITSWGAGQSLPVATPQYSTSPVGAAFA